MPVALAYIQKEFQFRVAYTSERGSKRARKRCF